MKSYVLQEGFQLPASSHWSKYQAMIKLANILFPFSEINATQQGFADTYLLYSHNLAQWYLKCHKDKVWNFSEVVSSQTLSKVNILICTGIWYTQMLCIKVQIWLGICSYVMYMCPVLNIYVLLLLTWFWINPSPAQSSRMDFMLRLPNCTDRHQMLIIFTNSTSDIWILRLTKQTCWRDFGKTACWQ